MVCERESDSAAVCLQIRQTASPPDMNEDLRERVKRWLAGEGFPFELSAGRALRDSGWKVEHGRSYEDPQMGKVRELDIYAHVSAGSPEPPAAVTVSLAIQCKSAREHPWVVFSSESKELLPPAMARVCGTLAPSAILTAGAKTETEFALLQGGPRVAHRISKALVKDRGSDASGPYATALSAVSAATALSFENERFVERYAPQHGIIELSIPVVLVDGILFEFYLNDDGSDILSEIDQILLAVPEPLRGRSVVYCLVASASTWNDRAASLRQDAEALASAVLPVGLVTVVEYMKHLDVARARRGDDAR